MEQVPQKKQIKGEDFIAILAARNAGNPKPPTTPEDEAAKYAAKTKAVEAQDQYLTTVDKIKNPPSLLEMQKEQAQRLADEKKAEKERADAAETRERERSQNDATEAKKTAAEAQQKRIEAEQNLQAQQNQILLDKLEELKSSQKPLSQQFEEYFAFADKVAEKMGYQRPGVKPVSENPQIALEIAKLELDSAREDRKFQIEMEDRKRDWDLKLLQMNQDRQFKEKELDLQAKKNEQLFAFPQVLGGAIAKGLLDRGQVATSGPAPAPQTYRIEIPQGETGTIGCPNCRSPIGIGPTQTSTQCIKCNTKYEITRLPPAQQQQVTGDIPPTTDIPMPEPNEEEE